MSGGEDPFRDIEELFDQLTQFGGGIASELAVDVVDADDEVVVVADLPGRDPETVQVQLKNNRRLHLEAPAPDDDIEGRYVTRERADGSVSRVVTLPTTVDESETEASYDRGVLTVSLPKPSTEGDGTDIPVN